VLPVETEVLFLISRADVLHAWTVPALGIKADAVPGRINRLNTVIKETGISYGSCREICGAQHSFIPITLERVPVKIFFQNFLV